MTRLAVASLRARTSAFAACFLAVFLGATVVGAFATLVDTATGDVASADRTSLRLMGVVVGSWGLVIVLFSVASTMTVTVRQRSAELSLLRTIGATARQTRRMVVVEATSVAAVAALLAAVPATLVGSWVLHLLKDADMVATGVQHRAGPVAIGVTGLAMTAVSAAAAMVATRRASRQTVDVARVEATTGASSVSRWRVAAGLLLLAAGLAYSTLTVTVMAHSADPFAPMSTAGPAGVCLAVGFAVLAPLLLRVATAACAPVLRLLGPAGELAAQDLRARPQLLAGVLAPVIVFVGIGIGTTYLVAIEDAATGGMTSRDGREIQLLNNVVVGMISVFAAIMVVNTLAAAVSARRRELGQLRLTGATPAQVRAVLVWEGVVVAATGIAVGSIASLGTILPYSWVKLDRLLPDLGPAYAVLVAAAAVAVVLASTVGATRRALRPAALEAVVTAAG